MLPWKALLVSMPVALAGGWALASASARLQDLRGEMARLEAAGRAEGESFVRTLEGAHAERQLEHFDRRRALALELARARRDQLLGVLGLVGAALLFAGARAIRRIGAEVDEERRRVAAEGGRAGPGGR
jgi:hypothetical protein